jgi:hypothetical protein
LIDGRARGNSSLTVSSLRRTMAYYLFNTPTVEEGPAGGARLFYFYKLNRGISIAKSGATYSQVRYPVDEDIANYDEFYRGGYTHTVDDTTRAALIAGNVGVTSANFTAL